LTLLAVDLVPKPVPPTMSAEMLKLCLVGLKEVRALGALSSLRSMNVSKILKSELLSLKTKITNSGQGILNAQHLALNILVDLRVLDIRPICAFLNDVEGEHHWVTLVSLAGALEKSTQGRVIPGLTMQDIQPFNPILQAGLKDFESDCTFHP
jgi:hypothetical protein